MSLLSSTGRIYLVKEPVCGRWGMFRLQACLLSGAFRIKWDGNEEITLVTFNKSRKNCSIFHYDMCGMERTVRRLRKGTFKVILDAGRTPGELTREQLERLLCDGTVSGPLRFEHASTYLQRHGYAEQQDNAETCSSSHS